MASIPTPNLAVLADPYAEDVFQNMWRNVYGFKDTVRTDYLKDRSVPAAELGADLDYLNNQYALDSASTTYGDRLSYDQATVGLGAMNAIDNLEMYPTLRGLQDQTDLYAGQDSMLSAQERVARQQQEIERRQATADVIRRIQSAPGTTPWDQAVNAFVMAFDDAQVTPQIREMLRSNMLEILQRRLATLPAGSPEYNQTRNLLITHGGFGVQPSAPTRPQFNTPRPNTGGFGFNSAPRHSPYTLPE